MTFNEWWEAHVASGRTVTMHELAQLVWNDARQVGCDKGYEKGYDKGYDAGVDFAREAERCRDE